MINNFTLIKNILEENISNSKISDSNIFYHLQIIQRTKDLNNRVGTNKIIKDYYIEGITHLEKVTSEIIQLCELFKARAYININPKDFEKLTKLAQCKISERIYMNDYKKIYRAFSSSAGIIKSSNSFWLIDIDDINILHSVKSWITENVQENVIYYEIPTKHGIHLIVKPFNLQYFRTAFPDISVHKNNPTILYIPNSLNSSKYKCNICGSADIQIKAYINPNNKEYIEDLDIFSNECWCTNCKEWSQINFEN